MLTALALLPAFLLSPLAPVSRATTARAMSDSACAPGKSPILILGTYHMSNPRLDEYNVDADDVRSERRQRELEELVSRIARFAPTRVMVEKPYGTRRTHELYQAWLAGTHVADRNEVEQIAFRLAKRMSLPTVIPVDWQQFMSGWQPNEVEEWPPVGRNAPAAEAPSAPALRRPPRPPDREDSLLRATSLTDYIAAMNTESAIRANHAQYFGLLLPDTVNAALYQRVDRLTTWYRRNLRIFANMNRWVDFGKDRVFLLIGAGHLYILRDLARSSPYYCLEDVAPYLGTGKGMTVR